MKPPPAVVAPSDLRPGGRAREISVGGRLAGRSGRVLTLADALCSIEVELGRDALANAGDLLVVRGRQSGRRLLEARIVERRIAPTPRGDGEFSRLAWRGTGCRLLDRARALSEIRRYFSEQGFIEVDTPLRVRTPGLDLHVDAIAAEAGFLVTSPEHHMKRLLVGGMPRIFQICHASRADELGAWHEPEFSMLEWYRAFSGQDAVIADTEQVVARVVRALAKKSASEIVLGDGRVIDVTPPFERLTVREAFARYAGVRDALTLARRDEDRFFELLVAEVEPALGALPRPVFLCEYPVSQASLARKKPDDPRVAERFELYLGGIELCNGFGELTDPAEQRKRFERDRALRRERERPVYPIDERLLRALEEGMPASGGNALGIDRLLALALGTSEIADVMPFPAALI